MKPIIVDINEISESTEVYESKPNPFLLYTIYLILIILLSALAWMYFSKIDILVKNTGTFQMNEDVYRVSSEASGVIASDCVTDGMLVKKGDILYTIENESLDNNIEFYEKRLDEIEERLEIMNAYLESLDGEGESFEEMFDNTFYSEFHNRRALFYTTMDYKKQNVEDELDTYRGSVEAINGSVEEYEKKIENLQKTIDCVRSKTNEFGAEDAYYGSIVNSYISGFNLTALQYNNQINAYNDQVEAYNSSINKGVEDGSLSDEEISGLKESRDQIITKISETQAESWQALNNLELQQITSVEQQIESVENTIISLNSNLATAQLQLDAAEKIDNDTSETIQILTEKENVNKEILSYKNEKVECQNYLDNYNKQKENCEVVANTEGFFYLSKDINIGTTIQEGIELGQIYPVKASDYYAEVYVDNSDIGKLKVGQFVNFEIPAFPSSDFGYFTGEITDIAKNVTVDTSSGRMYYIVKVSCNEQFVEDKDGKRGSILNGMLCEAKIIVDEQNVLSYILEKIDLID